MFFKITARTILQLGSELISSDAIAFYELIKNAFDAGSKRVDVRVVQRLPKDFVKECISKLEEILLLENTTDVLNEIKYGIRSNLNSDAYLVDVFKQKVAKANNPIELITALKKANYILIKDLGDGMSMNDLEHIYLTIGTRNRRKQRENDNSPDRPILGEKGLGRLSVMRLGDSVRVETTQRGDLNYNYLEIDWTRFSNDSDALLETIDIEPQLGELKEDTNEQGTKIFVFDLHSSWDIVKVRDINKTQLSRFVDPFERKNRDFIRLWYNTEAIALENINRQLFDYAHAIINAKLEFDEKGDPILNGEIDYKLYDRKKTFSLSGIHLASVINSDNYVDLLKNLGPFNVLMYWYNRQLLTKKNGVLDPDNIKGLVNNWGGGLMVYRDGFRVNPYGGPNDDWLELDPRALASPGYKLNRKQFVGKVDISAYENRALLDQTNREGLRENPEKKAMVALLQYVIWEELKIFFDNVKKEYDQNMAVLNLNDIEKRITIGQGQVRAAVEDLKQKYPQIQSETEILGIIEDVLKESSDLFKAAKTSSLELESRLKTTLDLAGLGLMVDVIAHELNRSTEHAIGTINSITANLPEGVSSTINTLRSQLKTLQTRLKVIDPLGPSGRQQKTMTDLKKLIIDSVESHKAQFSRHHIEFKLIDSYKSDEWNIRVVPGMIVQIVENLISNSVYWIKQQQRMNREYQPKIEIVIDRKNESILYSDNGPGIPREKRDDIFRPFFSTKPPGVGKGLGLYISQEIAKYHNATLALQADNTNHNLNTFILSLK